MDINTAFDAVAQSIANLSGRIKALEALPIAAPSYYNLVVNGGFEVWSHGVGPFTANGAEMADTWFIALGAGSTISVTQDTINEDVHQSASCAAVTYIHVVESALRHTVHGPFAQGQSVSFSTRVKCSVVGAVRLLIDGQYSDYNRSANVYETLVLVALPAGNTSFDTKVVFDASCAVQVDNAMCIQGAAPIDYIALTTEDNQRRITDY